MAWTIFIGVVLMFTLMWGVLYVPMRMVGLFPQP